MKTMNLRDANQQFSRLVKEVQETGETIQILRNGEPAAELHPVAGRNAQRNLTSVQQAALKSILDTAHRLRAKSSGRKMTRDEMHER
jgi:prevent-host-death family protein